MNPDEMRALALAHGNGEVDRDWDAVLATMTDPFVYIFYPYRLRITGTDEIIELWSRLFTPTGPLRCFDAAARLTDGRQWDEYVNDHSLVNISASAFVDEEGVRQSSSHVTRYDFEGDLMCAEIVYLDASFAPYFDRVFDDEFRALPGVEEI